MLKRQHETLEVHYILPPYPRVTELVIFHEMQRYISLDPELVVPEYLRHQQLLSTNANAHQSNQQSLYILHILVLLHTRAH